MKRDPHIWKEPYINAERPLRMKHVWKETSKKDLYLREQIHKETSMYEEKPLCMKTRLCGRARTSLHVWKENRKRYLHIWKETHKENSTYEERPLCMKIGLCQRHTKDYICEKWFAKEIYMCRKSHTFMGLFCHHDERPSWMKNIIRDLHEWNLCEKRLAKETCMYEQRPTERTL